MMAMDNGMFVAGCDCRRDRSERRRKDDASASHCRRTETQRRHRRAWVRANAGRGALYEVPEDMALVTQASTSVARVDRNTVKLGYVSQSRADLKDTDQVIDAVGMGSEVVQVGVARWNLGKARCKSLNRAEVTCAVCVRVGWRRLGIESYTSART